MTTTESTFSTHNPVANPDLRERWRALNGLTTPIGEVRQRTSSTEIPDVHVTVASPTRTTISTWSLRGPIS